MGDAGVRSMTAKPTRSGAFWRSVRELPWIPIVIILVVLVIPAILGRAATGTLFAEPTHPYAQALFVAALPGHRDVTREEIVLEGEVPSPIDPPGGCPFHPRCPARIGAVCETRPPLLEPLPGTRHWVSCHLVAEGNPTTAEP